MAAPLGEPSTRPNPCCIIPYAQEPIMTQSPGAQFERLLEIMRRLREPGGCPWDREQTRTSLKPFLIEEAYEALEAIAQWEAIKQREAHTAGRRRSVIDGVPRALPSLLRAQRIPSKASRVNFDWPDARAAWTKVEEECREAADALAADDRARLQDELGDVLFSLVNVARLASIDAEEALQGAIEKFRRRFTGMEDDLSAQGKSVGSVSQAELERSWDAVKAQERRR